MIRSRSAGSVVHRRLLSGEGSEWTVDGGSSRSGGMDGWESSSREFKSGPKESRRIKRLELAVYKRGVEVIVCRCLVGGLRGHSVK